MPSSHGGAVADNPFADSNSPSQPNAAQPADLNLDHDVRLSLTADSLLVSDPTYRPRNHFCGLPLPSAAGSTHQTIPYHNILSASLSHAPSGAVLNISHARPVAKDLLRPARLTYPLTAIPDLAATEAWLTSLLARAYPPRVQRHKRIKVLINPLGGRGLAPSLYEHEISPILTAAGCVLDVETTTHKGHAREIARTLDLSRYDAVACCSGDGTPHEVFNGLARHVEGRPRRALRRMAVAQLPCGSGNAMARNVLATDSPSVAALALVKGERRMLDLVRVGQGSEVYWSFLSQSIGIIAESDLGTDHLRWMGIMRFTVGFFVRLAGKTVYPAEVSVKVVEASKEGVRALYKKKRYQEEDMAEEEREGMDDEDLDKSLYGSVQDPVPDDWETADMPTLGNFYSGNLAWMSIEAPIFTAALPNDGLMDLITVDGTIPRSTSVKLLLGVPENRFFDSDVVSYRKIKAFRLTPRLGKGQKEGFMSIDGERVSFEPIQAEVVPGLGTVLSVTGAAFDWPGPPEL